MRTAALLVVLLLAKLVVLLGHDLDRSWWAPVAYLWQDAVLVVLFAIFEHATRRAPRLAWIAYGLVAGYVAATVPVIRALGTPLTWPMWRAAGGPLADSIIYYATPQNVAWIGLLMAVAIVLPRWLRSIPAWVPAACVVPLAAMGPAAAARADTRGLERNAWSALALSALPRVSAEERREDWRETRADRTPLDDLSRFRGAATGRNVVLVSLESTAAQYLGLYGASPDIAPNLSALARTAVVFEHAYAVYPESIKGLFAMLCSAYPAFDRGAERYADVPCRSPAAELADRGYRTALFHSGRFAYLGMEAVIRNRGYGLLADAGDIGGARESSFGIDEQTTVARILDWIDRVPAGDRFFLTYLPIAGHHPYEASRPGPFPDRDEFGRYRNAIYDGDAALGALVDGLRARGLDRRTTWIVIGDHGEAFGQHDANYGHTFHLYDENVRVPFLVAAPGLWDRQVRSGRVISLIDTAPTILDLAGIRPPDAYRGQSAFGDRRRMALFFADYSLGLLGLRDGPVKFIYEIESGRSRLFNVEADPRERQNVADEHADAARDYAQHLTRWIRSVAGG